MTIYLNHCQVAWYFQTKPGCLFDYPTVPERQPCLKKNLPHHPLDAHSSEQFLPHKMTQVPQTGQSILQTHCWGYPSHLGMGQKFSKLKMPKKKNTWINNQLPPATISYHQLPSLTITDTTTQLPVLIHFAGYGYPRPLVPFSPVPSYRCISLHSGCDAVVPGSQQGEGRVVDRLHFFDLHPRQRNPNALYWLIMAW